ncbi:cytochrome c-type biogenesis protein [Kiloniella antarctica]|uniref:Cytochrome c-type biogenesis protein n=1 Tax=Kiloniella antarctica TaxID=1550907 RepID=A0ABW5BGB5_9PROT
MRGFTLITPLFFALMMGISLVQAVEPDEVLDDPVLEARAREISKEVRCLVCQNEPIDSSNADLAKELRIVVRERLVAGDSDDDVKNYLSSRYGDFVLFRPPFKTSTLLLWFGPLLVLVIGVVGITFFYRGNRGLKTATPLSAEEQDKLQQLLFDTQESPQKEKPHNKGKPL